MKVCDLEYKRVDVNKVIAAYETAVKNIEAARSAEGVLTARRELLETVEDLSTASSLSYARWSCNTKDEFYKQEKEYYEQNYPLLSAPRIAYIKAMLNTPYKAEVSAALPAPVYKSYEVELKTLDERIIPELQEESAVVNEYAQFMSELTIEFNGEKMPLTILKKYMNDRDRSVRKAAFDALGAAMEEHADILDGTYDRLVKIRDRMAKKLGYKDYVELGYYRMGRLCYDRADVEKFRQNVLEDIVPVVSRIRTSRAKENGIDEMKLYDYGVCFANGDPAPVLDANGMFEKGREMYREMSKETGEFIDMMIDNDAFDVLSREGKWGGGYCTEFAKYKQPFILANFNGTSDDVDVLTHEAGHAFASYLAFKNNLDPECPLGMETAETHSMSMECLCWKYMDKFFGARANDYKFKHLFDNLSFLTYGVIVDEFQHRVYEKPEMTPAERNAVWNELEKKYRPYMNADGMRYFEKGTRWQYQMHIYESPFYYIDYCLAQSDALQFLFKSLDDYSAAFESYLEFTSHYGSQFFTDMLSEAGIRSPFEKGALKDIAAKSEEILNKLK